MEPVHPEHPQPMFCNKRSPHSNSRAPQWRAAPDHRGYRKSPSSKEDPVQPKVNKQTSKQISWMFRQRCQRVLSTNALHFVWSLVKKKKKSLSYLAKIFEQFLHPTVYLAAYFRKLLLDDWIKQKKSITFFLPFSFHTYITLISKDIS